MLVRHRYTPLTLTPTLSPTGIDRTFSQIVSSLFDTPAFGPAVRADWDGDDYVIAVDLPGVPASDVSVEVTGNSLRLAATSGESQWSRTLRLGGSLDPEKVTARHVDGRLTVRIGKVDQPDVRKVEIDTTPAPAPAIEASTGESADDQSSEQSSAD